MKPLLWQNKIKTFVLVRDEDVTGVSGTGKVAEGVQFSDGLVVLRWEGDNPSTVIWADLDSAMQVHGHGGKTRVVWTNRPSYSYGPGDWRQQFAYSEDECAKLTHASLYAAQDPSPHLPFHQHFLLIDKLVGTINEMQYILRMYLL